MKTKREKNAVRRRQAPDAPYAALDLLDEAADAALELYDRLERLADISQGSPEFRKTPSGL
jgi:hypothetical protein